MAEIVTWIFTAILAIVAILTFVWQILIHLDVLIEFWKKIKDFFYDLGITLRRSESRIIFSKLEPLNEDQSDTVSAIFKAMGAGSTDPNESATKRKKILVIGDVMLDHVVYCNQTGFRQSQTHNVNQDYTLKGGEKNEDKYTMGGAAHVAYACSILSDVTLFGVVGKDFQGEKLKEISDKNLNKNSNENSNTNLNEKGSNAQLHSEEGYITIEKIYYDCTPRKPTPDGNHEIIRINREYDEKTGKLKIFGNSLNEEVGTVDENHPLVKKFSELLPNVDGVVFKDHEKGFLSPEYLEVILPHVKDQIKHNKKSKKDFFVFVDPKYNWEKFGDLKIDAVLPNVKEAAFGIFQDDREIKKRVKAHRLNKSDWIKLEEKYKSIQCFAVTQDEYGAALYRPLNDNKTVLTVPVISNKDKEKSEIGCGDVFDAYFIGCMMNKKEIMPILDNDEELFYKYSLRIANYAAELAATTRISEIISPEDIIEGINSKKN